MSDAMNAATEFNTTIKFLGRVYASKKKGTFEEEKALRNNKRIALLMEGYPLFVIEECGPFFLKYADVIQRKDFDEILKLDFQEEKNQYKSSEDGRKHSFEAMDGKIKFLKNMFKNASAEERSELADKMETLLSSYCKYAIAVKAEKK